MNRYEVFRTRCLLDSIWTEIKDSKQNRQNVENLRYLPFTSSIEDFKVRHRTNLNWAVSDIESVVTSDLENALYEIQNGSVKRFHISCAGGRVGEPNTALCIHYQNKDGQNIALALLGVTYQVDSGFSLRIKKGILSQEDLLIQNEI